MKTNRLTGPSSALNGLNLPSGMLAIDTERKALRVYDGVTPGGFEMVGVRAVEPPVGPGPETLTGGDATAGFYGEVTPAELITYSDLATLVGLSDGNLINDAESLWLKFTLDEQILFIAKKTVRSHIKLSSLSTADVVAGTRQITVGDHTYRIRLMDGITGETYDEVNDDGYDTVVTHNSEWNRLMYPIHSGVHTEASNPDTPSTSYNQWAAYSDADLRLHSTHGAGSATWCRNLAPSNTYVFRGLTGVTRISAYGANTAYSTTGWRPVLELVT